MNRRVLIGVLLLAAAFAMWWWTRPLPEDVDNLQQRFVRIVCDTDALDWFAANVGRGGVQSLVGTPTPRREGAFARVNGWLEQAGAPPRERRAYRKIVGCKADAIARFDAGVVAGVAARCQARNTASLPGLVTLIGVVAQSD